MDSYKILLNASCLLLTLMIACGHDSANAASKETQNGATAGKMESFKYGGYERTYSIKIPGEEGETTSDRSLKSPTISKSAHVKQYPLVIALHGGGGSAKKWPKFTNYGFERLAEKDGFILVYPEGLEGQWNDERNVERFYAQRNKVDDVGFLGSLIEKLSQTYPIDRNRIYAVGASNGGMMTNYLGAKYSHELAAIATVIASIPTNLVGRLHPTEPISVLIMNGTEDPLVRPEGGPVKFGRKVNGEVIPIKDTVEFWVKNDQCNPKPKITELPDIDPKDGTRVTKAVYSGCKAGTEVVHYTIIGGGHAWPAYEDTRGKLMAGFVDRMIGKKSRDIDACEVIWEFFKNHPKKK